MIAFRPPKVKAAVGFLAAFAALSLFRPAPAFSDPTEPEVQNAENQEFGIDNRTPPSAQTLQNRAAPAAQPEYEDTRPIDAEEFRTIVKKKSSSGHVLLLDDPTENHPRPGKILLLKDGETDVAAVRVLKNYPGKFAAKIVLPFGPTPEIAKEYRALKKLGDKLMDMIRTEEAKNKRAGENLSDEDLAKEVAPDDAELDRGIPKPTPIPIPSATPAPSSKAEPLFDKEGDELNMSDISAEDEDEGPTDVTVRDNRRPEPLHSALSVEYAGMKNVDKNENIVSYESIGLRYAYNFAQQLLFKNGPSDILSAELSFFYYKIVAFQQSTDQITLLPVILTARYGLMLGESITPYLYAGFVYNKVLSTSVDLSTTSISDTQFAGGIGLSIKIGPAWAIRGDFGTDMLGVGAVLKF